MWSALERNREPFARFLESLSESEAEVLQFMWRFWARPNQIAPPGHWHTWLLRAGRGFGKTRTGAGWFHERMMSFDGRWGALIAKNPADARDYMIEGPGGFLRNTHPAERPSYEVSKRRVTWPNGSYATIYSDEEPEQVRGFSGDTSWLDEFAKYRNPKEVMDNLDFGMREVSNDMPRRMIGSTPKPIPVMMDIEKPEDIRLGHVVVTFGNSYDNEANLDPRWFANTISKHEGTRFGRQEIHAEYVTDVPGALWTRATFDKGRISVEEFRKLEMRRIVIGVDPSGTKGDPEELSNQVGIVAVGLGKNGKAYVIQDKTCSMPPAGWGREVVNLYHELNADVVVAEANYGGEMVRYVIQTADAKVPVKIVHAARGKVVRAEPIASLYDETPTRPRMIYHVGHLGDLEDQMVYFLPGGYSGPGSPDRADAAVWALTDLLLLPQKPIGPAISAPYIIRAE